MVLAAAVELRVEPGREKLRPQETAAVVVRPALPEGSTLRVVDPQGGWLSRPYRRPDGTAVLYTAPPRPGRYTIEARLRAVKLEVQVEVTASAPSYRPAESISFGPEPEVRDVYRDLAEHYAPAVAQETWFEPKADYLARFDYDGDWRGDNNWDNLASGSSQAYVYWAAMETATHYFLMYNLFHPRRYAEECSSLCQENDNEGLLVVVRKDGSRFGRAQLLQTLSNNALSTYTSDARIREGVHRVSGDLKLRDSHPLVFVESGTHGVYGTADPEHARFSADRMEFLASTGVVYRFGGVPGRPAHPNDRDVSYELLPIGEQWWPRAISREGRDNHTFNDYVRYLPYGNRPGAAAEEMGSAFFGRKYFPNKARPFWGWHDAVTQARRILAPGQWGLDPAYAVASTLKLPQGVPFSLDYLYNPFLLGAGRRDAVTVLARPQRAESPSATPALRTPGGERHVLSSPAEKPKYNLRSKQGQLEFRGRVDGSIYLHIRGDQIEVEYLSGRPMDEIRYRFSQPLPGVEMEEVKLEDVDGRGSVRLLEWPNQGNQYTAKVRIQDEKPGASLYRFKLAWKR